MLVLKKNVRIVMNNKMGDNMRMGKKSIIALALCLGVFFMAIGYSILMTELKINGSANISSTWDIRITGISNGTSVGSAYNIESPSFTATTAKFNVSLVNPGDSMTYLVTITNQGTLTAILNSMDITTSGTDAIIYEVTGLKEGDTVEAGSSIQLQVKARYNSNEIADPTQRTKRLKVGLDWVQYTNQTISAKTYTVSYSSNSGSGSMSSTTCTIGTACTLSTNAFTRSGYKFLGWSTTSTGAQIYRDGESVTNLTSGGKSITLYAVWGPINNYAYNGSYSTFTVPVTGYYQLEVWGAQGGYRSSSAYSGKGGYSTGKIFLEKDTILYIYVGGNGTTHFGYNGGGISGCTVANGCTKTIYGGGATDIRINSQSLYARVIVAGGGGSVGASAKTAGAGGGTTGESITTAGSPGGYFNTTLGCVQASVCGQGGTQTAGGAGSTVSGYTATAGSFGQGGMGYYYANGYGGAGGGGWYGGSGSIPDSGGDDDRGGGGGSGYVFTSSSSKPTDYLLSSHYYMTNASTLSGTASIPNTTIGGSNTTGRSGDGYARITRLTIK